MKNQVLALQLYTEHGKKPRFITIRMVKGEVKLGRYAVNKIPRWVHNVLADRHLMDQMRQALKDTSF